MATVDSRGSSSGVNSYAIVALPARDQEVWRLSSEKVPHLTMLFLGDQLDNLSQVKGFIRHLTQTSLGPFELDVHRRGILGDQSADVLFFRQDCYVDWLKESRSHFLTNDDIRRSYESVEQYPEWIPHLTLGYPETPAKPDAKNTDDPVTLTVMFDRIALWTGDYEGVEFPLKSNNEALHTVAKGEEFLKHYGIKGMRWGRRRDQPTGPVAVEVKANPGSRVKTSGGKRQNASDDAIRAATYKQKAKKSTVDSLSNKELQDLINRMNMEQQYTRLRGGGPLERGTKMVKQLIGLGEASNKAYNVGQTLVKDIKK